MISQIVDVVEADHEVMTVKPQQQGCGSCSSGACGVSNLSRLFGKREYLLKLANHHNFRIGDTAELLLDESLFIRSVTLQYLLPLMSMIVMVLLVSFVSSMLAIHIIAAVAGLSLGVYLSRHFVRWNENQVGSEHLQVRRVS